MYGTSLLSTPGENRGAGQVGGSKVTRNKAGKPFSFEAKDNIAEEVVQRSILAVFPSCPKKG